MSNMTEIKNRIDFFRRLSNWDKEQGYIKFNIPDPENPDDLNGEGVWGWVTPDDKARYNDDEFHGKISAILCNYPLYYDGILTVGDEVVLQCHGDIRPTLDPEWVKEHIQEEK